MARPFPGYSVTPTIRLERELGGGGMGRVWLAHHATLHVPVVVKFLSPEYAGSPEAVERFSREASAASSVRSPHVVQMLDHGVTPEGDPYIVMEHLEGRDLRAALASTTRLAIADVVTIVAQVGKALTHAHRRGVVHRDIKPENIFLCDHGGELFVKLLDFGIAKAAAQASATDTGTVIGTPPYMSPEQLVGQKLDSRTDLWSLGVVAYEALTGRLPFEGDNVGAITLSVFHSQPPPPSVACPPIGTAFDSWFARACARDLHDRFATAAELVDSLVAAAGGDSSRPSVPLIQPAEASGPVASVRTASATEAPPPGKRSRAGVVVVASVLVIVLGGVAILASRRDPTPTPVTAASSSEPVVAPSASSVIPSTSASASAPTVASAPSAKPAPKPIKAPKKSGKHDVPIY
jgi:serine/threonine-protein kinase